MKKLALGLLALLLSVTVLLTLVLPPYLLQASNQVPEQSPADVGLSYEDVYFQPLDENIKLHAWWIPAPNSKAIMLMVHGANGSKEGRFANSLAMYQALALEGLSLLAIDLRNHGTSGRSEQGELGMGLSEMNDLIAALDFIEQRNTDDLPVFSFGLSMGGAAVIHLAEADPRTKGLILFDPMLHTADALTLGAQASTALPAWLADIVAHSALAQRELSPNALTVGLDQTLPTLLLQDVGDPVTRAVHADALAQARPDIDYVRFNDPDPEHWIYQEHGGWGTHVAAFYFEPVRFISAITAFVDRHLD